MRMRKRKWVGPYLEKRKDYLNQDINLNEINKDIYLEIGSGMGDFIINSAINNPDIFYIGLEKDETCVAKILKRLEELNLDNVLILLNDANELDELFDNNTFSRIYLLFSDPWPKKRNHKRRLTYPTFLNKYYSLLKDDGDLIFKSDNDLFFEDSLTYVKESAFKIENVDYDYHKIKRDDILTGYEKRFINENKNINYLRLIK